MCVLEKELCQLKQLNQRLEEEISCRKLVESKLRSFETQMRAVLEGISDIMLVVSIGIAQALLYFNMAPQVLINKADEALYKAKKAGRNCYYTVFK